MTDSVKWNDVLTQIKTMFSKRIIKVFIIIKQNMKKPQHDLNLITMQCCKRERPERERSRMILSTHGY